MRTKPTNFLSKAWIFTSIIMLIGLTANATVINIPSTADSLEHFLEVNTDMYANGDTIMLTSASYVVNGTVDLYHGVTILGDPALGTPPIVQFLDNGFRLKQDSVSVYIKGITFNGYNDDSTHRARFILRMDNIPASDSIFYNMVIEDVEAWGFGGGIDLHQQKHAVYDSIIVDNVYWHDFLGEYCIDPNINFAQYISVTNSTFAKVGTGFVKNPDFAQVGNNFAKVNKEYRIEHNTFYEVAGNNNSLIQVNDPADSTVTLTFKNNIVSKLFTPDNARPFRINLSAGDFSISNSIFHDYDVTDVTKMLFNLDSVAEYSNVDVSVISNQDPGFADPENGDFTTSVVVLGDDDTPIGDPDWTTNASNVTLYQVPNSYQGIIEQYLERSGLIDDGDTIMLISSGTYVETGTPDIYAGVTIMGDPSLLIKPEIRMYDNGFRPKEDTISIVIKNIKFNGLKADSSSRANYVLRFDQGAYSNWNNIIIQDVDVINTVGFVQFSKTNWCTYDSVLIDNVTVTDITGKVFELRHGAQKNMTVQNSTFSYIQNCIMDNPYFSDGTRDTIEQKIVVDHNTFFNVSNGSNRFIQMNDPQDSSITFIYTNNIASTIMDTANVRPFDLDISAGEFSFSNSTFFNFESNRDAGIYNLNDVATAQTNVFIENISEADPEFRDTNNFTFPVTSDLMTAGTDGGSIGDPRWVPEIGVSITALGEDVLVGTDVQLSASVIIPGGGDETVTWSVEGNYGGTTGAATIGSTSGLLSATSSGQVKVTATLNENASYTDTLIVVIIDSTHVSTVTIADDATVIITPNPAVDFITITSEQQSLVSIYNVLGSKVMTKYVDANGKLYIENLENGIYFVNIQINDEVKTIKLIKK